VLARVLLARAEPGRALGLLDRLDALAEFQGRAGSVIEIRALRALALQAAGDHQGALTAVAEALSLAQPERYVRVFADEGPRMAALLKSLMGARRAGRAVAASGAATEHLNRVVQAFGPAGPRGTAAAAGSGLIEPLTARELEVLSLIAAGRRNREIANELVVTIETVKKHTSHIFDKLGAANRTQAVTRARELGLVP
jgi:LuxR family transcriptional regulator, maltose regulon positive regulatory protein